MEFQDVLAVTELRGSYPDVKIDASVDYAALIAGDSAPMFLTIPIGKAGSTSGNKRHYDEAFVQELERQTLANKPIGLMGHLSQADRATAFPAEAVHWVGAARDGDTLWGKAYVVPGPVRERIARYKAQGKAIATSIDAFAEGIYDKAIDAMRMTASTLRLNQIDIAPADRAGIPSLAAIPMLTTEMEAEAPEQPQETVMDKLQVINEMTADDARLLPQPVREAVLATVQTPPQVALVTELCTALGIEESALKSVVTEMQTKQAAQAKAAVKSRIVELASDAEKGVKVESVRGLVVELVEARQPASVEEAETAYASVLEMQAVKAALVTSVQTTMGPPQRGIVQLRSDKPKYFVVPQGEAN